MCLNSQALRWRAETSGRRAPFSAAHPAARGGPLRFLLLLASALAVPGWAGAEEGAAAAAQARAILGMTGFRGGLLVQVGSGDGRLALELGKASRALVQGLETDPLLVTAANALFREAGVLGPVSAARWDGPHLPHAGNLVNLLVCSDPQRLGEAEVERVLAPGGGFCFLKAGQWTVRVKARPPELDDWPQYLHDAGNNAVSHDLVVGPPTRLQWQAAPRYSRHHDHLSSFNAAVTEGGRFFSILDEGSLASILLPSRWMLVARDAFNGVLLWKRALGEWQSAVWPLKSGPAVLPRRLVAGGGRVFLTLALDGPLKALEAATGKELLTYPGTEGTEEVLFAEGNLFLVVRPDQKVPRFASLREAGAAAQRPWPLKDPRVVLALEAASGRLLWQVESRVSPLTLAVEGRRVYYHNGERIVCLDRDSGARRWMSRELPRSKGFSSCFAPTLVVREGVVLFSGGGDDGPKEDTRMEALDAGSGKQLWEARHPPCGYQSPKDLLVAGGLVWSGAVTSSSSSGEITGRDLHTGEVKRRFSPELSTYWFHHRCYRAKATDRYLLLSRTGVEFVDLARERWEPNHWVRGACLYGVLPANGLLYAPPHPCACYSEAKLSGFLALSSGPQGPEGRTEVREAERLERGVAAGDPVPGLQELGGPGAQAEPGWPTYRHDPGRSGAGEDEIQVPLRQQWRTVLGGRLSPPTLAEGKVFVAAVDAHTVHALAADSGRLLWSFSAQGRVDSPPTLWRGRVLFGSADGHLYCLRAADGALVWRYRAVAEERLVVVEERLESAWPVHGSVLVLKDVLYAVAGRSMFLDGGLRLLRLDPASGRNLGETVMDRRDPERGGELQDRVQRLDMPVALPDILSSDGERIYMRSQALSLEGRRLGIEHIRPKDLRKSVEGPGAHLFSPSGFLDQALWHRSYWVYGKSFESGAGGYFLAGRVAPAGRLLVFDQRSVYGFGRQWRYYRWSTPLEHHLFAADRRPEILELGDLEKEARRKFIARDLPSLRIALQWSQTLPVQVCALALGGQSLCAAGPPDLVDEEEASVSLRLPETVSKLQEQADALDGRKGSLLLVSSKRDGRCRAAYRLSFMPCFDGLITVGGRLYCATVDGSVVCLGAGAGEDLEPAHEMLQPRLGPIQGGPQTRSGGD